MFKNDDVRVWTLDGEVLIASITAKLHPISPSVIEGLLQAVEIAEATYQGLVIWSPDEMFSAGADLEALLPAFMKSRRHGASSPRSKKLQDAMLRIRYASVPVVSAVRGMALGGGCELAVHSAQARRGDGKLHRPGRSRRRPDARRRRPDLHRAPRRREARRGNANADLLQFLTDGFTSRRDGQGRHQRDRDRSKLGYLLRQRRRSCRTRTSCCTSRLQQAKAMADSRLARAAASALFPVAGRSAHRDDQGRSWSTCATAASSARTTSTSRR